MWFENGLRESARPCCLGPAEDQFSGAVVSIIVSIPAKTSIIVPKLYDVLMDSDHRHV